MNRRERRKEMGGRAAAGRKARRLLESERGGGRAYSVTEGDVPAWILEAVEENEARIPTHRMPLTTIRRPGATSEETLVVIRFPVFLRWLEAAGGSVEGGADA